MEEIIESPQSVCQCEAEKPCEHNPEVKTSATQYNEDAALAFLVALTPLAVFTLLGQIGLL